MSSSCMDFATVVLDGSSGIKVILTEFGARVLSLQIPHTRHGMVDVTTSMSEFVHYIEKKDPYYGCTVGRVANRIRNGEFLLEGQRISVSKNEGAHSLHGGVLGWSYVGWKTIRVTKQDVVFEYVSIDGEEGYPGMIRAQVSYALKGRFLEVDFYAIPSCTTPINMTNHMYFNVNGMHGRARDDQVLIIPSERYIPVNNELIPHGTIEPVENTPFDFRSGKSVEECIDHTFVINEWRPDKKFRHMCSLIGRCTDLEMKITGTQPGFQVYGGDANGIALEPQYFPDSVNQATFPSILFSPENHFRETIRYEFNV